MHRECVQNQSLYATDQKGLKATIRHLSGASRSHEDNKWLVAMEQERLSGPQKLKLLETLLRQLIKDNLPQGKTL